MEVTAEFFAAGASAAGGYTRRQVQLLGLNWPPPKGWKKAVIGSVISDDSAAEFLQLAGTGSRKEKNEACNAEPLNWCGASVPIDIYLYVLSLEGNRYYVGLTTDIDRRVEQHFSAIGAEWTKRHKPLRLMHCINTGTRDGRQAEGLEDEATIALMITHGIENVRGGHFLL